MENNTDQQLRESELYWNETVKPNLPTHSKDFIPPAWVIDFADQYGRHVRQQSLSELSAAKKQIEELKAWNTEQASIIESFMQEIERLKADKKQVEWIAASDMDKLIDGEVYCVYYQKGDTKARVTAEYKNGKWLMHWARAVVDITDSVTHHQEFPPPPASLSPQTPEP